MHFTSSEQDIAWFVGRYREGTLELKPPFQRKPVWVARQKCYLVESILIGLPVPEIYIQRTTAPDGHTTHSVVDGQQRIRTILQFVGAETEPDEQEENKFPLDKLAVGSPWRNVAFDELTDEERTKFFGYIFAVRFLNTQNDAEVRDMFMRLNRFLTPLNAQELRNATYLGPFVDLALKLADDDYWAENRIVSAAQIRRMNDVEFVSELLIGVLHGPQGGSARIVDAYYGQYEDYEDQFPEQRAARLLFKQTLGTIQSVLPEIKGTRWHNKTDFYSLFVAIASLLRSQRLAEGAPAEFRRRLAALEASVDRRLADDTAKVSKNVAQYVRAVEKGANDKARRADRHAALLSSIRGYFEKK